MVHILDVAFLLDEDPDWQHLMFHTISANGTGTLNGKISNRALDTILAHVPNRRVRNILIMSEACERMEDDADAKIIIIDEPLAFLESPPSPANPLEKAKLVEKIKLLDDLDLAATPFATVLKYVKDLMDGAGTLIMNLPPNISYWRARVMDERPQFVAQLSSPPAKLVKGFQRCNGPGKPMFYCSDSPTVAMRESGARPGTKVYLSRWDVISPIGTATMPPARMPRQDAETFAQLTDYINRVFTDQVEKDFSHKYMVTAALTSLYATGRPDRNNPHLQFPISGVFYRSVVNPQAENLAINAEIAAQNMKMGALLEMSVELHHDNVEWIFKPTAFGEVGRDYSARRDQASLKWRTDHPALRLSLLEEMEFHSPRTAFGVTDVILDQLRKRGAT